MQLGICTPSNWYWSSTSGGFLAQTSNIHKFVDGILDGTKLMYGWMPVANAHVSAKIWSSDNDAAGIVFRFHNTTHYYMFTLDEERSIAQIVKRNGGSMDVLNSSTLSGFDWSVPRVVKVTLDDATFTAYMDGTQLFTATDPDKDYMDGQAGVVLGGMGGTNLWTGVDDFLIQHIP